MANRITRETYLFNNSKLGSAHQNKIYSSIAHFLKLNNTLRLNLTGKNLFDFFEYIWNVYRRGCWNCHDI